MFQINTTSKTTCDISLEKHGPNEVNMRGFYLYANVSHLNYFCTIRMPFAINWHKQTWYWTVVAIIIGTRLTSQSIKMFSYKIEDQTIHQSGMCKGVYVFLHAKLSNSCKRKTTKICTWELARQTTFTPLFHNLRLKITTDSASKLKINS